MSKREKNSNRAAVPAADMEPIVSHEPMAAQKVPRFDSRVDVVVISHRYSRHDPEGVSVKAAIDGLVASGILADDSTEQIRYITFASVKARSKDHEKTVIVLEEIGDE